MDNARHATEFPDGFTWGVATSAFQVEGAAHKDARGDSVWDMFCRQSGAIRNADDADVACDHYNRWRSDVELMRELGVGSYRFSISWPRILPDGTGQVNEKGLSFYDQLVDLLLESGIEPMVTLFHWDFPLALHRRGGWLARESAEWFVEYTRVVVDRLADRVSLWCTLNEPQVFIDHGHGTGGHAPGLKLSLEEQLLALHHCLLAHGRSVQVIRARAAKKPTVGWAVAVHVKCPATESPQDIEAARTRLFATRNRSTWQDAWYSDAACLGQYPEDGLRLFGDDAPKPRPGDMQEICQPLDYIGLNIYSGAPVVADDSAEHSSREVRRVEGSPRSAFDWPVAPESLRWGPRFYAERYQRPIMITENGMANLDWESLDGHVHDPQRIDFTHRYLQELHRAIADGADIRAYYHWSLLDNFEWAEGFDKRFGLVHVDFATLRRTPKDSFRWYRDVIDSNGRTLFCEPQVEVRAASFEAISGTESGQDK